MFLKVSKQLKVIQFIIIGIGLIKKLNKNLVKLQPEFYYYYINKNNSLIELKEHDQSEKKMD